MTTIANLKANKIIGVLNLQGAVTEHLNMLASIDFVCPIAVKQPEQLLQLDGLIIPGGILANPSIC